MDNKKRIKETGEIVVIEDFFAPQSSVKTDSDYVDYTDKDGNKFRLFGYNIYQDFEPVEEDDKPKDIDWEERTFQVLNSIIQGGYLDDNYLKTIELASDIIYNYRKKNDLF